MADEYSRSEYLRALLNQQRSNIQQGGNLLNPAIGQAAEMQSGVVSQPTTYNLDDTPAKTDNFWTDVSSFFENFTTSVFRGIEGMMDALLTPIDAFGNWVGWDMSGLDDWIETDLSGYAIGSLWKGFEGDWSYFTGEKSREEYYQNPWESTITTKAGQVINDIGGVIGNMLPSIIIGGVAGGGEAALSAKAAKGISVGSMALSAQGQGTQEALQEGADVGSAWGYGFVSGAIEAVTEYIFPEGGVGGVKFGKKALTKSVIKEIGKEMVQEGIEEVASELLSPFAKAIYKGTDAFYDDEGTFIYFSGNFYKDVAKSFGMGAITGGIMTGGQTAINVTKMGGVKNYELAKSYAEVTEKYRAELEKAGVDANVDEIAQKYIEEVKPILQEMNALPDKDKAKILKFFRDPNSFKNMDAEEKKAYSETVFNADNVKKNFTEEGYNTLLNGVNSMFEKTGIKNNIVIDRNINNSLQQSEGNIIYGADNSVKGYIDRKTGTIHIADAYKNEFGALVRHEAISHAILDNNTEIRDNITKIIQEDADYKKIFDEAGKKVIEDYKTKKGTELYKREQMASFLEQILTDTKKLSKVFGRNAVSKSNLKTMLNRIRNRINLNKSDVDTKILNQIDKAIKSLQASKPTVETGVDLSRSIAGEYKGKTKGDTIKVEKVAGGYEIVYPDGQRISEAYINEETVADEKTGGTKKINGTKVEFKTPDDVRSFLRDRGYMRDDNKVVRQIANREVNPTKKTSKSLTGTWNMNDGRDSFRVEKNNGIYQIFERKGVITEYTNPEDVAKFIQDRNAVKNLDTPQKLVEKPKVSISKGKAVYVKDSSGNILTKKIVDGENGKVKLITTKADGEMFTKEFNSFREAKNAITSFTQISNNKADLVNKEKTETKSKHKIFTKNDVKKVFDGSLEVYHGTANGNFKTFDNAKDSWSIVKSSERKGVFTFTDNPNIAREYSYNMETNKTDKNSYVLKTKIKAKKVLIIDADNHHYTQIDASKVIKQANDKLTKVMLDNGEPSYFDSKNVKIDGIYAWAKQHGYDGVAVLNVYDRTGLHNEFSVFDSKNIEKTGFKKVKENVTMPSDTKVELDENGKVVTKEQNVQQKSKIVQSSEENLVKKASRKIANRLRTIIQMEDSDVTVKMDVNKIANILTTAKDVDVAMESINKLFNDSEISVVTKDGSTVEVDVLKIFDKTFDIKEDVKSLLEAIKDPSKVEVYKERLANVEKKLRTRANEMKARISQVKQISKERIALRKMLRSNLDWTDDNKTNHTLSLLGNLYNTLDSNENGYTAHPEFIEELDRQLMFYTEDQKVFTNPDSMIEFSPEYRRILEQIKEGLPKAKEINLKAGGTDVRYASLNADTLALIKDGIRMLKSMSEKATQKQQLLYAPYAQATIKGLELTKDPNAGVRGVFNKFGDLISSRYAQVRNYLGNTPLAYMATTELNRALSSKDLYVGDWIAKEKQYVKEHKIRKILGKKVTLNGAQLTYAQLADLYNSINTPANYEAINNYGIGYVDNKGRHITLYKAGVAEQIKAELEKLPQEVKDFAKWTKDQLNGEIKQDYIKWYKETYGVEPNEIDDYWELTRMSEKDSDITKATMGVGIFKRSISRVKNEHQVRLNNAKNVFEAYVQGLANEVYVKPLYRDIMHIINDEQLHKVLRNKLGSKLDYIENMLDEAAGKKYMQSDSFFAKLTAGFTLKNLSFNIGSMMKQFASIFTSNLPIHKTTKMLFSRTFRNKSFNAEYSQLYNEIGSLKYRSGVSEAETNNTVLGKLQVVASKGMSGITGMDKVTIETGLKTLMMLGKEINHAEYGTQENIDFVKEHWDEFILSQIGNNPLNVNEISRAGISRYIFGYMQGANRAAVGSQINKILTYSRNHKLDIQSIKDNLKTAKSEAETLKTEYETSKNEFDKVVSDLRAEGLSYKSLTETEEYHKAEDAMIKAEEQLVKKQGEVSYLDNQVKSYSEYEIMGGKTIPLNMAAGLLAQGIFITLVNELMKHIKGKKDWDDWFGEETISETLLNTTVGWIPVVNSIVNYFVNDYDIEVASATVVQDILGGCKTLINLIKGEVSGQEAISSLVDMASNITGIPVKTLYGYATGIVNMFDEQAALKMGNAFYAVSYNGSLNKVKTTTGNEQEKYFTYLQETYKVRNTSEETKKELLSLYNEGFTEVLPKNYIASVVKDGVEVPLEEAKISQFRTEYDKSEKAVNELIKLTDYQNADSETKAKLIKKVYDTYYNVAKARISGSSAGLTKLENLLYSTNNISVAKYILLLNTLSSLEVPLGKTKKDVIVNYLNKSSGLTKQEKLLVMMLSGYSMDDVNSAILKRYLKSLGVNEL